MSNANGLDIPPMGPPFSGWGYASVMGAGPSFGRIEHTALLDSARLRMIIFGGRDDPSDPLSTEVWNLYDPYPASGRITWSQLHPLGELDGDFTDHSVDLDAANNRMIIFGGTRETPAIADRNDVFILSGANGVGSASWAKQTTFGPLPPERHGHAAAYDAVRNRLYISGGESGGNYLYDTWMLELVSSP